ncbi:12227_t:CDS:2, partial [Acaulospora colombiana]
ISYNMPGDKKAKESNVKYSPTSIPTAVFIGGTSGIGRAMVELFGAQTKGRANILILGRNKAAAHEILANIPAPPAPSEANGVIIKHEFISCDASLMKNIPVAAKEIAGKVDKINYLVCSFGVNLFSRKETEEGLDISMALRFYGRFKFFHELLPLVQKAKDAGEDSGWDIFDKVSKIVLAQPRGVLRAYIWIQRSNDRNGRMEYKRCAGENASDALGMEELVEKRYLGGHTLPPGRTHSSISVDHL